MLRKLASKLHLYLGLLSGLLLIPIGLTGSVLVFDEEIEGALHEGLVRVEPRGTRLPVDHIVSAVRSAFPEHRIARMELPQRPHDSYEIILGGDGRQVYVDPYGGEVLGSHLPGETLTGWLFLLHVHLLAGERGKTVVGIVGLFILVLGVTGLVLWWRGLRNVLRGLTIKWRSSGQRINYDLHNVVGVCSALPLLAVAFTGAGLIFYGTFSDLAHRITGTELPPAPPVSTYLPDAPAPSLDTLLAQAQAALPRARLARVDFPATPEASYRVRLRMPEEAHPIGLSMVYFDQYSGRMLHAESAPAVPAARRFGYWFYPIHIGSYGGPFIRLLYALLGLVPAVLAVTGGLIWYLRWLKRRRPASPVRKAGTFQLDRDMHGFP